MTDADPSRLNAALIDRISKTMRMPLPARVADAFRAVPRHLFLPGFPIEVAYADAAILIKDERGEPRSSSSQPTIMAIMLTQLDLREGDRVLEIGAGSGYNAALIAELVGRAGHVVTVDLDDEIAGAAREKLAAAGARGVEVVAGDGAKGYPPGAPYDRIIATAAVWDVPAAWRAQLAADGRMVMPLMIHGGQACVAFRRVGDELESDSIVEGGFMPLRGSAGRPTVARLFLGSGSGLSIEFTALDRAPVTAETAYGWLTGRWTETATPVTVVEAADVFRADMWLALRDPAYCRVSAYGEDAEHDLLPHLPAPITAQRTSYACGLADECGLALMSLPDARFAEPETVRVRRYGDADAVAARLVAQLESWVDAGRGAMLPRRIRILPRGAPTPAGATVLERRESVLVVES